MLMQSQYVGLFNTTNNGNSSNRIFAVEFNTKQSIDIEDIDEKHEGIDVNGFKSIPATCFSVEERNNKFGAHQCTSDTGLGRLQ